MRRLLALLVLTALPAAACAGGADDGRAPALAAEVLSRVDDALGQRPDPDPDEVVVPEGCRLVVETDEYGFETEIVVCDEPATTTTTAPPGTDPTPSTTTPPPTTTTVAPERPPLDGWTGSAEARTIARALRRAVVEQTGCDGPADLIALQDLAAVVPAEALDTYLATVEDLRRSSDACNVDPVAWQAALEEALDHLEQLAALLGDANG